MPNDLPEQQSVSLTVDQALQKAIAHHQAGQLKDAEQIYRAILQAQPNHPDTNHNLGVVAVQKLRPSDAIVHFKAALEANPGAEQYWLSYIDALIQADEADAAKEALTQAQTRGLLGASVQMLADRIQQQLGGGPSFQEINRLAQTFTEKNYAAASVFARQMTLRFPSHGIAWKVLGVVLQLAGRNKEALIHMRRAVVLMPKDVEAHNNLGVALGGLWQLEDAVASYRRALAISPDFAEAHYNLSTALKDLGQLYGAAASCRRALAIRFDYAEAHSNLSLALAYLSNFDQVVEESDTALALKPDDPTIWEQRLYVYSYHPDLAVKQIYEEFVRWGNRFPDPELDFSKHDRTPGRRLRIGYVSPDFRGHTSRFFFWPLFANHDQIAVELYAYSNVSIEDGFTKKFKGLFEHWRNIRDVADCEVAQMIREDRIDILVDGCSHMRDDRLGVFAMKPAPIQATWLGAAWTTGLKTVDYALIDAYMAPEGTLAREAIVRLPHCFVAYRPPDETAEILLAPCLKKGHITFGYSGRTERLNHRVFKVWGEILRRIPTAKLVLDFRLFTDPATQAHYRQLMTAQGVDLNRVIMRNSDNIFSGLNDIDIMVDSFPHSGGTMLFDALWMGVPILTLASRPPLGRIGTTLMMNLGLPQWVAYSEEDYVDKAIRVVQNPNALANLRAGMRERMRSSPIMDGARFARGVEDAYRGMYEKWCEKTN